MEASQAPFAPERLLPDHTLALLFADLRQIQQEVLPRTAYGRLWADPALEPFRQDTFATLRTKIFEPLKREFKIDVTEFGPLLKGPVAFAMVSTNEGSWVFLAETTDGDALRTKLQILRSEWRREGKARAIERLLNEDFTVVAPGPDSVLMQLKEFLPRLLDYQELGRSERLSSSETPKLYVGQVASALVISGSSDTLEELLARAAGSAAPELSAEAGFQSCRVKLFMKSPLWFWVNARSIAAIYRPPEIQKPPPPSPVDVVDDTTFMEVTGIRAVTAAGWAVRVEKDGVNARAWLQVAEADRKGFVRLLAGEPHESGVPSWVPADTMEFSRWRLNGQKTWANLERMMTVVSPEWTMTMQSILQVATDSGRAAEPGLDVKKALVENLGDDFMILRRKTQSIEAGVVKASAVLYLIGSPQPEALMQAVQRALLFMASETEPQTREFLGRTIHTIPLPSIPLPLGEVAVAPIGSKLHYAATSSYLALCTDASILEEFLRSPESRMRGLGEATGMRQILSGALTPFSSSLSYESELPWASAVYASARTNSAAVAKAGPGSGTLNPLSVAGLTDARKGWSDWFDCSALPPFRRVAKHFNFRLRTVSADGDGITIHWQWPVPREQ